MFDMFQSTKVMEIQSKLDEKSDECAMLQDSVESLKKTNTDQATKIDSFIQRIKDVRIHGPICAKHY